MMGLRHVTAGTLALAAVALRLRRLHGLPPPDSQPWCEIWLPVDGSYHTPATRYRSKATGEELDAAALTAPGSFTLTINRPGAPDEEDEP